MFKNSRPLAVLAALAASTTIARAHEIVGNRFFPATTVTTGKATVGGDRTQMRVGLKALPAGTYNVKWRVLSVDTHRTEGDFSFRVGP